MNRICIIDTETTGVDPGTDKVIEVACILWDVQHATSIATYAGLLPAADNPAAHVNGIPPALLVDIETDFAWQSAGYLAQNADAFIAHNASFDRSFVGERLGAQPWICSMDDVAWSVPLPSKSMIALALAHDVAVTAAHRALADCQLLARVLEACHARGQDVGLMLDLALAHALLPKYRYVSLEPFERKDDVKAAGFRWDDKRREWWRVMAEVDAEKVVGVRMRRGAVQL